MATETNVPIYPSNVAPLDTRLMADWLQSMGLSPRAKKLGVVLNTAYTGAISYLTRPMAVKFNAPSLADGTCQVDTGIAYKQGYFIQYDRQATAEPELRTSNLEVDKHYMLCIAIDLSKKNSSAGSIKQNNYFVQNNQLKFEYIEYDPTAANLWAEAPFVRAMKSLDDTNALPVIMLADINTASTSATPTITMLNLTYEHKRTVRNEGKQLALNIRSNQSQFPTNDQVNKYGNNTNQTTVVAKTYPITADVLADRTYTVDNNLPAGSAMENTQRIPFLYQSYAGQPYFAGRNDITYNSAKPWTGGLTGRNDGTQPYEFLEPRRDASSFICHTAGIYKFVGSVMLFNYVSWQAYNRWSGINVQVKRGANAPVDAQTQYSCSQEQLMDNNYISGSTGSRNQGYGLGTSRGRIMTMQINMTVTLYEGDEVFFCHYCDRHDIGGGTTAPRYEHENLTAWYMQDPPRYYGQTNLLKGTSPTRLDSITIASGGYDADTTDKFLLSDLGLKEGDYVAYRTYVKNASTTEQTRAAIAFRKLNDGSTLPTDPSTWISTVNGGNATGDGQRTVVTQVPAGCDVIQFPPISKAGNTAALTVDVYKRKVEYGINCLEWRPHLDELVLLPDSDPNAYIGY